MAIVTLRLNQEEEKVLEKLVEYFDEDKSRILKEAMWDKFEELRDRELIEDFERANRAGKIQFGSADDLINKIEEKRASYGKKASAPLQTSRRSKPQKRLGRSS